MGQRRGSGVLIGLLLGASLGASGGAAGAQQAAFELVGTHPQAAAQRTVTGKTLAALEPWKGRLYAGYGDYGDNTGPIAISPFDPVSGSFEQVHLSDTEAILNWRPIGDRLFAPSTDRRKSADYSVGEPWADVGSINTTHAYDMVSLDGSDLWLTGSQGSNAAVWRSLDGGGSWKRMLAVGPDSGIKDDFARFYFAGVLAGRLYVQADNFYGDTQARSQVFDGSGWAQGPNLLPSSGMGWRPVSFGGQLIYRSFERGGSLLRFDEEITRQTVAWNLPDFTIDGDTLIALTSRMEPGVGWKPGPIVRSRDLESWEALAAPPPADATSLAILEGRLYVGAKEARLHRLGGEARWTPIVGPRWNALPSLRLLAPRPGASFAQRSPITFLAEAADPDGGLTRVQFWNGQTKLGEPTSPPYTATWTEAPTGTHRILARAIDANGAMGRDTVSFQVLAEGGNHSPRITGLAADPPLPLAGKIVRLTATATDPDGDPVELRWFLPGARKALIGAELSWLPPSAGAFDLSVIAEDSKGAVDVRRLAVEVSAWGSRIHLPLARR